MNYQERVLAYIDILGFKNTVNNTVRCSDCKSMDNEPEINRIDIFLDEIHNQLIKDKFMPLKKIEIKDRVVSQISDSVVISYLKENAIYNILQDVYFLCVMALEKGFLFRGAVVCGKVIHTEKKLFGPAFLRAYNMEQEQAVFPRIIIDDNVLDIVKENYPKYDEPNSRYDDLLKLIPCDFDGKRYINYIDKLNTGVDVGEEQQHLSGVYEIINKLKEKINTDAGIGCKYLWLKEKYDISQKILEKSLSASENSPLEQ